MPITVENAEVFSGGVIRRAAAFSLAADVSAKFENCLVLPGLADVHVHLREPGFSYKETIRSGSLAAASAGYTCLCPMPNLDPVPDCAASLAVETALIARDAAIDVVPYGAISRGRRGEELAALDEMAPDVAAFSDDGSGVQDDELMRRAMRRAKSLGKLIAAHCEDNTLLCGGYIHDGDYARAHGHRGISSESEWRQIERDLALVRETGCAYHVCHISTRESVELIRAAKREGLNVSCETAPHYLLLDDAMLQEDGRFKMNPPLRSKGDRLALIDALLDGTIDMIATDHAPHSAAEKSRGLAGSAMGVVGLETAFPLLYTYLVLPGVITLEKLIELMSTAPRRRFGLTGEPGWAVYDLNASYLIDPERFVSLGRSTPFAGYQVNGRCLATVNGKGETVWLKEQI